MIVNRKRPLLILLLAQAALVLTFVLTVPASAGHHAESETMAQGDIVDVAVAAGDFETLTIALQAAGLVDTLKGDGPFTVFAPTDEAFAKLPGGTVEDLLEPENGDHLVAVLTYHVVPGNVSSAEVVELKSADTVNGKAVTIAADGSSVRINQARVVKTDIPASNGVIHVIDEAILPPSS